MKLVYKKNKDYAYRLHLTRREMELLHHLGCSLGTHGFPLEDVSKAFQDIEDKKGKEEARQLMQDIYDDSGEYIS